MTGFSEGVWRQELTLLEVRGVRWNFGNHHSSRAAGHFATQPSVPTTVTHLLLSFPHFFDSSFSMAKKNENTLSIFLFKLKSSVVSNPKSGTQLGSSLAHKQEFRIQRPSHHLLRVEGVCSEGWPGVGRAEMVLFYIAVDIHFITRFKKLMMNRIYLGEFGWS